MKLFLQSSSGQPSLGLWENGVLFEANYGQMRRLDYGAKLEEALRHAGRDKSAIEAIIVDIGPGRLGSTRTAVAFANGLGFALGIPILPVSAFTLLGTYAEHLHGKPCLILRSAARRQYHWALVQNGQIAEAGFAGHGRLQLAYEGEVIIAGDGDAAHLELPKTLRATWLELNAINGAGLEPILAGLSAAQGPVVPLVDTQTLLRHA